MYAGHRYRPDYRLNPDRASCFSKATDDLARKGAALVRLAGFSGVNSQVVKNSSSC